jgi:hypothetical protein
MGARSLIIECPTELVVAEAMVALYGTNFSLNMGFRDVIMEEDALQIVKEVKSNAPCFSNFGRPFCGRHPICFRFLENI